MDLKQHKDGVLYALVTISVVLIWKAVNWLWLRPRKIERCLRRQGLKGNPYTPVIGDVRAFVKYTRPPSKPLNFSHDYLPTVFPYNYFLEIMRKYGNNCFMWFGPTPWLITTDLDKIKDVLTKYEDYQKPHDRLTEFLSIGLFGAEGDQWAKHRKIINPAFHIKKLKNMFDAVYESCTKMTSAWEGILSEENSVEVDVMPFVDNLSGDVISRAAFGSSYEEGKRIFELQAENVNLSFGLVEATYIPGWRYVPNKRNRRQKQICKEIDELLTRMINLRKKEIEAEGRSTQDDLLGILLESNMREIRRHGDEKGGGLTTAEVVEECKIFYLAGSDTTSSLLTWTLVLLSKYHIWQERAREEVLQMFGKNGKPKFEALSHMKVLNMIIYEVLRLYPPAHMFARKVLKETHLKEWVIPAGTEIIVPLIMLNQDCNIWGEDAKEFNPGRFSEGVSKATKGQRAFIPFSIGPRTCIGQNLALLEAKLALTMILQRFSFDFSPTYKHAPRGSLTLQAQYGAHVILHKL